MPSRRRSRMIRSVTVAPGGPRATIFLDDLNTRFNGVAAGTTIVSTSTYSGSRTEGGLAVLGTSADLHWEGGDNGTILVGGTVDGDKYARFNGNPGQLRCFSKRRDFYGSIRVSCDVRIESWNGTTNFDGVVLYPRREWCDHNADNVYSCSAVENAGIYAWAALEPPAGTPPNGTASGQSLTFLDLQGRDGDIDVQQSGPAFTPVLNTWYNIACDLIELPNQTVLLIGYRDGREIVRKIDNGVGIGLPMRGYPKTLDGKFCGAAVGIRCNQVTFQFRNYRVERYL